MEQINHVVRIMSLVKKSEYTAILLFQQDGGAFQDMSEVEINMLLYPNDDTNSFMNRGCTPKPPAGEVRNGYMGWFFLQLF